MRRRQHERHEGIQEKEEIIKRSYEWESGGLKLAAFCFAQICECRHMYMPCKIINNLSLDKQEIFGIIDKRKALPIERVRVARFIVSGDGNVR